MPATTWRAHFARGDRAVLGDQCCPGRVTAVLWIYINNSAADQAWFDRPVVSSGDNDVAASGQNALKQSTTLQLRMVNRTDLSDDVLEAVCSVRFFRL